jgi:hypothetical protein
MKKVVANSVDCFEYLAEIGDIIYSHFLAEHAVLTSPDFANWTHFFQSCDVFSKLGIRGEKTLMFTDKPFLGLAEVYDAPTADFPRCDLPPCIKRNPKIHELVESIRFSNRYSLRALIPVLNQPFETLMFEHERDYCNWQDLSLFLQETYVSFLKALCPF